MLRRPLSMLLISTTLISCSAEVNAASPQPLCGNQKELRAQLAEKYHEKPTAFGVMDEKVLVEVYSSPRSWTILQVRTDGIACIMAAGSIWGQFPETRDPGVEG